MAADETREGQDIAHRIREELERIRESESRVEEALEAVRQARRRVEVIVRALVREELSSSGATSPRDVAPLTSTAQQLPPMPPPVAVSDRGDVPPAPSPSSGWGLQDRRARIAAIVALVVLAVAGIGWFAIGGLQKDETPTPVDTTAVAPVVVAPVPAAPTPAPDVLASAPADPAALVVFYDSLFAARSPIFDTLIATVEQQTSDRPLKRAIAAWRGGSMDAQQIDLVHSAMVQRVLKLDTDPRITLDGQLLRNPCRGRACLALLKFWKVKGIQYGLPQVPADAATNVAGLRQAEVALVFGWLKEVHQVGTPTP